MAVEFKNLHNFDETWMTVPLCYKKIKSDRKTANINTNKNLAIANSSRVSWAHNTSRASIGLNIIL